MWLPDRQTDAGQSDPYVPLCIVGDTTMESYFLRWTPAKIFQFNSRWTGSTKSSAVGQNHMRSDNTSNEVKCPLLSEFRIYNFSLRIFGRVFVGSIVNIRNECLFFLGSLGMNCSVEQAYCLRSTLRFTKFVCPALRFIPTWTQKKRHSFLKYCGWLYFSGYQFSWFEQEHTFIGIKIRGA